MKLIVLSHLFGEERKSTMTLARRRYWKSTGRINHREEKEIKEEKEKNTSAL